MDDGVAWRSCVKAADEARHKSEHSVQWDVPVSVCAIVLHSLSKCNDVDLISITLHTAMGLVFIGASCPLFFHVSIQLLSVRYT